MEVGLTPELIDNAWEDLGPVCQLHLQSTWVLKYVHRLRQFLEHFFMISSSTIVAFVLHIMGW